MGGVKKIKNSIKGCICILCIYYYLLGLAPASAHANVMGVEIVMMVCVARGH